MEEKENIIEGEENLNNEEKTSYTAEEVAEIKKQMQSNSEKWVQKLISEKKVLQEMIDYLPKISENPEVLLQINEENPAVAKAILDKYYDWINIEDFAENLNIEQWDKKNISSEKDIEKIVNSKVEKKLEAKLIAEQKEAFIAKMKLSEDEIKDFEEAFSERQKLKSFDIKNLQKVFEKAYRDIDADNSKLEEYKKDIDKAGVMASGSWAGANQTNKKVDLSDSNNSKRKEVRDFLSSFKTD